MMVLGQFPARSFEELFQGVRAIRGRIICPVTRRSP